MKANDLVRRARTMIGQGCHYWLGRGGFNPNSPVPWDEAGFCDCSGFISWCLGVSRHTDHPWYKQQNGGWLETSAIVRDAHTKGFGMFDLVESGKALPGDLVVYGDQKNQDGSHRQGHVGLITEIDRVGAPYRAIHCSKGNDRQTNDAIRETPAGFWMVAGGIVARCALVEYT